MMNKISLKDYESEFISNPHIFLVGNLLKEVGYKFFRDKRLELILCKYKKGENGIPHWHTEIDEYEYVINGEIGYKDRVEKLVLKQASLIKKAGLKGIVASGSEAKIIRKKYKNLFILTPGIKLPGDKKNWDQARVNTPNSAFKAGASAIVLGWSLVSGNLKKNIKILKDHLNQ